MKLEISNFSQPFDTVKIFLDGLLVSEHITTHQVELNVDTPVSVRVEFTPYKVKPIVRLDNFMLNFWLADILLYDHCLEFNISDDFFQDYRKKDIQGRLNHIPKDQKNEHYVDKYIGLDNLYPDLVSEIKKILDI